MIFITYSRGGESKGIIASPVPYPGQDIGKVYLCNHALVY